MTISENPYEVGPDRLVALDKPHQFIGREALTKLAGLPLKQALVGLTLGGDALESNEEVWPLFDGHKVVGRLTSLSYSPRLEANIALLPKRQTDSARYLYADNLA